MNYLQFFLSFVVLTIKKIVNSFNTFLTSYGSVIISWFIQTNIFFFNFYH